MVVLEDAVGVAVVEPRRMPHEQIGEVPWQLDEAGAVALRSVHSLCFFPRQAKPIDALIPVHSGYNVEQVTNPIEHLECEPGQSWHHASLRSSSIPRNEPLQLGHDKTDMLPKRVCASMLLCHETCPGFLAVHELHHLRSHLVPARHILAEDTRIQILLGSIDVMGGEETLSHSSREGLITIGECAARLDVENPPPSAQEPVLKAAGGHRPRYTRGCINAKNGRPLAILNHSF
mmetsp:Transcript_115332/g.229876  ORF Transcript_115332/g.229876 Transcript_115332/m.229876 type:complete len:233 (+) Transcript_115332:1377-2075(+)